MIAMTHSVFVSTLDTPTLVAKLAYHCADWQICFLNNLHRPVIGILPKISWQLSPAANQFCLQIYQRDGVSIATNQQKSCDYQGLLDELLAYTNQQISTPNAQSDNEPTYHNGLMGFVGYDISANALNPQIATDPHQPACFFGHYDCYLTKTADGFWLHCDDQDLTKQILAKLRQIEQLPLPPKTAIKPQARWQKDDYRTAFEQAQAYLLAGDGYQINLTQTWQAPPQIGALSAHLPTLLAVSNAPFAGYVRLGDFELLSVSPELFFSFIHENGQSKIITKPIKGTRPRADDPVADQALKDELANSDKDIAENLMIVDLLRNDLGKYAITGGVKTPKRFAIESFYNVHHMVSTITATLKDDIHPLTVLFGSLPAGSITGAPKKRACEMIDELESKARGAYCGTLGFVNFDGTGEFNVLIRTIQSNAQEISVWAGGGVTIRSNCDDEYQECFDKVGRLLDLLSID